MKGIKIFGIILLLLVMSAGLESCKTSNMSSQDRKIQREKKKRAKNDTVLYQKALKHHMKSQTKETRKSMRSALREANRNRNHRREPFYSRWYKNWFREKPDKNSKG